MIDNCAFCLSIFIKRVIIIKIDESVKKVDCGDISLELQDLQYLIRLNDRPINFTAITFVSNS